jgi:hypothetical protein
MRKGIWLIGMGLLTPAMADVTVVRTLQVDTAAGEIALQARGQNQLQGKSSRRDVDVFLSADLNRQFPHPRKTTTLILLQKNKVHYREFPNDTFEDFSMARWGTLLTEKLSPSSETRPVRITRSWSRNLPDQDTQEMNGFTCTQLVYEWRFELEDTENFSKKQYLARTTLWLADVSPLLHQVLVEESNFQKLYHERLGERPLEGLNQLSLIYAEQTIGMDRKALYEALNQGTSRLKKIVGYPIASTTEWFSVGTKTNKPLFTVHSQLESVSLKPLAATLFTPSNEYAINDLPELPPISRAK